jgi:hypothetical protein
MQPEETVLVSRSIKLFLLELRWTYFPFIGNVFVESAFLTSCLVVLNHVITTGSVVLILSDEVIGILSIRSLVYNDRDVNE